MYVRTYMYIIYIYRTTTIYVYVSTLKRVAMIFYYYYFFVKFEKKKKEKKNITLDDCRECTATNENNLYDKTDVIVIVKEVESRTTRYTTVMEIIIEANGSSGEENRPANITEKEMF